MYNRFLRCNLRKHREKYNSLSPTEIFDQGNIDIKSRLLRKSWKLIYIRLRQFTTGRALFRTSVTIS